ncbi:hypothetical protein CBNA_1635 [Coxiella burnetii str. Namibia]|nr:hypothetical protein CBNA_1635 [Coxiella burnetii str. Namibia]
MVAFFVRGINTKALARRPVNIDYFDDNNYGSY